MTFSAGTDWLPNGLQFSDKQHNLRLWLQPVPREGAGVSTSNAPLEDCFGRIPLQENKEYLKAQLQIPFCVGEELNPWGRGPPTTLCIESCGTQLPGLGAPKEILEEIIHTWKIPNELFDAIQKPGSFPQFTLFEANGNLHIGFRWSSTPGCYLIFFGSTAATQYGGLQFRAVLSHRGVLTSTWNADVMKGGEDIFGQWEYSPLKLAVMLLNQCEKHLENSVQQHAERIGTIQGYLPYLEAKSPAPEGILPSSELYAGYKELTTSIFTLRNSCRNLKEICSGLMLASKTAISSKSAPEPFTHDYNIMVGLRLLHRGIERTHARLKFHLNRIDYLEDIHIQSTKSMVAMKQLFFSDKDR